MNLALGPDEFAYGSEVDPATIPPEYSDDAAADLFALEHCASLRYTAEWNKWHVWTGSRWEQDKKLEHFTKARKTCRRLASIASNDPKLQKSAGSHERRIASVKMAASVITFSRADPRIAATIEQWDADPLTLCTPGGTVDLRTGDMREPHRENYCTRSAAVGPSWMPTPTWSRFLHRVTGGDVDLQHYLARVAGYALTGDISEHALFFFYGRGRNGKGVFMNTLRGIAGDYAAVATMTVFTESKQRGHAVELAMLHGARQVIASETAEGSHWDEQRIKSLTGGDPVTANFMRQDPFTFTPKFKLLIAGNHKPKLRTIDEAIRARMHLVPFTVTIPPEERDPKLTEKLEAEWPGILQWAIDGCREWQRIGLKPPQAVVDATADYLDDQDDIGSWISERCEEGAHLRGQSSTLYASWRDWQEKAGVKHKDVKTFKADLEGRGFEWSATKSGKFFSGLRLIPQEEENRHWDR